MLIGCDLNWHVVDARACWERSKQVAISAKLHLRIKCKKKRGKRERDQCCRGTSDCVALYNVARVVTLQSLTTYI